jgi:predicted ester cyclase
MIAEGDLVAYHSVWTGIHLGESRGIRPTGRRVEWHATCYRRVRDGKVVELWGTYDWLGVLEQLGATVTPPNET